MILHHCGVTLFTLQLPFPISICSVGIFEMETGTDDSQYAPDMDRHAPLALPLSSESFMPPVNLEPHIPGLYSSDSIPAEMPVSPCTTDRQYLAVTPITPMEEQGSPFPAKTGKPEVQCDRSIGERVTVQYKLPSYCTCSRHRSGVQYVVIDCSPVHLPLFLSLSLSLSFSCLSLCVCRPDNGGLHQKEFLGGRWWLLLHGVSHAGCSNTGEAPQQTPQWTWCILR